MHPFYRLPLGVQRVLACVLAASSLLPFGVAWHVPWVLIATPLWISWGFFASTPLLRWVGVYRYYGPYLCAMFPTSRRLDIHLGTTFDQLLTLRWADRGRIARAQLLAGALEGLLAIADDVERGHVPAEVTVEGTSWFFTASTARRLGFELAPPTLVGRLIPWLIAIDILLVYSFTQGRFAIPPMRGVRRACTTGQRLLEHRDKLHALHERLVRRGPYGALSASSSSPVSSNPVSPAPVSSTPVSSSPLSSS